MLGLPLIEGNHLVQDFPAVHFGVEGIGQKPLGAMPGRWVLVDVLRAGQGFRHLSKDLDRVREAHRLRLHHPIDHGTPDAAGPEAVPEVLFGGYDQARIFIRMKGT